MWTDWQYTSPADAKTNLAANKTAQLTGQVTTLVVSGVRTEFNPHGKNSGNTVQGTIRDLQRYIWEIEANEWDWQAAINPHAQRPGQTAVIFT